MFEKVRVRWAISNALLDARSDGLVESEKARAMNDVAGHLINARFGAELLRSGAAVNRHAAAAAVFARLASAAMRNAAGPATAEDWVDAGVCAMVNAGAKRSDARGIVMGLIGVDRASENDWMA
jgi:hypothetical protein